MPEKTTMTCERFCGVDCVFIEQGSGPERNVVALEAEDLMTLKLLQSAGAGLEHEELTDDANAE